MTMYESDDTIVTIDDTDMTPIIDITENNLNYKNLKRILIKTTSVILPMAIGTIVGVLMNNIFDKLTAETPGSSYDPAVDNPYGAYWGALRGGTLGLLLRITACSWSICQNDNDSNTNRNAIETISEIPTNATSNSNQPQPEWTNTIQQECSNLENVAHIEKITNNSKQFTN